VTIQFVELADFDMIKQIHLLNAMLFNKSHFARVVAQCKVCAIIRPRTRLTRSTLAWRHDAQTNSTLCIRPQQSSTMTLFSLNH